MSKKVLSVVVLLAILILLAVMNLIWKFSMSDFNSMGFFRKINVAASIILVISGSIALCGLLFNMLKRKKNSSE